MDSIASGKMSASTGALLVSATSDIIIDISKKLSKSSVLSDNSIVRAARRPSGANVLLEAQGIAAALVQQQQQQQQS